MRYFPVQQQYRPLVEFENPFLFQTWMTNLHKTPFQLEAVTYVNLVHIYSIVYCFFDEESINIGNPNGIMSAY